MFVSLFSPLSVCVYVCVCVCAVDSDDDDESDQSDVCEKMVVHVQVWYDTCVCEMEILPLCRTPSVAWTTWWRCSPSLLTRGQKRT